ncbi:rhomboid family intramembrane serine protease [Photobacterium sagamiensis]
MMIIFWFLKDIYGAMYSHDGIAYIAHIAGFLSGLGIGWFM